MIEFAGVAGLGFLLGLRHATDADHVVAVTTIVAEEPSLIRATRIGGLWGVGHTGSLLALGGAIIAFRLVIPPRLGLSLELAVAVMLVALGLLNLAGAWRDAAPSADRHRQTVRRPLLVGTVHGLAGSAAVALLVLGTIDNPWWAGGYLLVFGGGTIAGMMLVTTALTLPARWLVLRTPVWARVVRGLAGALSLLVGVLLAHDLIVDGNLFGDTPRWDPH